MKNLKRIFAAVALVCAVALPSSAQFRLGARAGIAVNSLHASEKTFDSSNRAGFTGGLTTEFTVPLIGIGVDASVLYARRTVEFTDDNGTASKNNDYINIPINLKYKITLPVVGKIIAPFITTGPDFSFLVSGRSFKGSFEQLKQRKFDTAWTVGAGVELISHLQIAANYGFGLNNQVSGKSALYSSKNRCWTITASYYF
ncbi:MAG: PorT family protein [Muribaculaceae bacterium]|nr:PorT family protein [Muribaculaceae bacterium]